MLFTVFGLLSASTSCRLRFYTWQVLISWRCPQTRNAHGFVNCSELQSLQANGIPMAQIRPGLRYLGTAGLTKAFDKLHNPHAAASALRLGLPKHVVKAWSAAWKGQRRILHMRHSCSMDGIGNLPQGDLAPLDSCVVSSRPLIVLNNGSLIPLSLPNVPGRQILVLQQAVNLFTDC